MPALKSSAASLFYGFQLSFMSAVSAVEGTYGMQRKAQEINNLRNLFGNRNGD